MGWAKLCIIAASFTILSGCCTKKKISENYDSLMLVRLSAWQFQNNSEIDLQDTTFFEVPLDSADPGSSHKKKAKRIRHLTMKSNASAKIADSTIAHETHHSIEGSILSFPPNRLIDSLFVLVLGLVFLFIIHKIIK